MATKFTDIYNRAIFRFSDYSFLEFRPEKRDEILSSFLMSAKSDFVNSCSTNLNDYDLDKGIFNNDLTDEEQEILALGIAYYWLSMKTMDSQLLKNIMTRKDYNTYSPANLLKELSALKTSLKQEFRGRINEYSYRLGTLDTLKVGDA